MRRCQPLSNALQRLPPGGLSPCVDCRLIRYCNLHAKWQLRHADSRHNQAETREVWLRRVSHLDADQKRAQADNARLAAEAAPQLQTLEAAQAAAAAAVKLDQTGAPSPQVTSAAPTVEGRGPTECAHLSVHTSTVEVRTQQSRSMAAATLGGLGFLQDGTSDSLVRQIAHLQAAHAAAVAQLQEQSTSAAKEVSARAADKAQLQAIVAELQTTLAQVRSICVEYLTRRSIRCVHMRGFRVV